MKRWLKHLKPLHDVPFQGSASEKWMPWVMGLMIFLSTLCVMIFIESWFVARGWQSELKGRWTLELTPSKAKEAALLSSSSEKGGNEETRALGVFQKQVLEIIGRDPSVAHVHVMERPQLMKMLEPWLGTGNLLDDLPLPLFVDVECHPHQALNVEKLHQELTKISETVTIQDHEAWYQPLVQAMHLIQGLSVGLGVVIFIAAAAIVMIVMSMNVSIYRDVVHTLQLIGAQDAYVVKQFQSHARYLAMKAWLIGVLPSAESLALFQWTLHSIRNPLPTSSFSTVFLWLVVLVIPVVFGGVISLTTRWTVLKELHREPV